jgi:hypothetical protein
MKNKILSLALVASGMWTGCLFDDSNESDEEVIKESLVINEFISRNKNSFDNKAPNFLDEEGKYSDWIELRNNGELDVNLSDYYLSDDADSLYHFTLRDTVIKPGGYYVIFANPTEDTSMVFLNHAPFKLSYSCGDEIYLVSKKDSIVRDSVLFHYGSENYNYLFPNESFGRNAEGFWVPQEIVTPNAQNSIKTKGIRNTSGFHDMDSNTATDRYDPFKCEDS